MSRWRDISLFLLLSGLWGLSFPAISVGLDSLPPLLFAAFRYDVAALLLLGVALAQTGPLWPSARNDRLAVLGGGLFLVAGNGLLFIGQQTVPSGVAAILQALVPVVTALWAFLLLDEGLSLPGVAGVAIGLVGIVLIVQPDPNNLLAGDTVGRLIILLQTVSVALGGVLVQRASPTLDRIPLTGWSMALGALVLHAVSLGAGERIGGNGADPTAVGAVLYLGVFSTAIAFYIYYFILGEYGAFEASLVTYLVPIVATVVGVFVLDEAIGLLTFVGFGLVAVGFVLLKRRAIVDVADIALDTGPL